jgi:acetyl-CoA/propionyl-CoA carboxylase biotin carboxyl carrier protein
MLAKIVAWAPDRPGAIARLTVALRRTTVLGPATNLPFLIRLLEDPDVRAGDLDTGLIERKQEVLTAAEPIPDGAVLAALLLHAVEDRDRVDGPWGAHPGWRLGEAAAAVFRFAGESAPVLIRGTTAAARVQIGDALARPAAVVLDGAAARIRLGDIERTVRWAIDGGAVHLAADGRTARCIEEAREDLAGPAATARPELRSPMPGTVVTVTAADGEVVGAGDAVLVVEAMKMEHTVTAPLPGALELLVEVGDRVARDQVLARIRGTEEPVEGEGNADE